MTHTAFNTGFIARFECLGAECEDTCCKGWGMQVDPATQQRYVERAPELMQSVTGEGDNAVMRRDSATDYCVKFDGGLCGIQKQYGTDFLGDACHFYPRVTREIGDAALVTATLSCPEIARLALLGDNPFTLVESRMERIPQSIHNYLPEHLNATQALSVHDAFLATALSENISPERAFMRIFMVAQSLEKLSPASWPEAVPFYLENAEARLQPADERDTDPFYLLQALCGLVAAAKKVGNERLMQTIGEMEKALHVTMRWETLAIASLPDSSHAAHMLAQEWQEKHAAHYAPILRRYLAAQLSLAFFPFAGFGDTLAERVSIIGVRFATIRLALMSAAHVHSRLGSVDMIRVIQSLSRFMDHLADAEFSLKIYDETGWLQPRRMRALVGDNLM